MGKDQQQVQGPGPPPTIFDRSRIHEMILNGIALPSHWVPWIVELAFYGEHLENLSLMQDLSALTSLVCGRTQVSDLSPLQGLTALTTLSCSSTQVSDLSPLQGLTALTRLDCSRTQVRDLSPLQGLTALTELHCGATQVSDLSPLQGLTTLTSLDCSSTQVSDLSIPFAIGNEISIWARGLQLSTLPPYPLIYSALERLHLFGSTCPGIDPALFGDGYGYNCRDALIAHFIDMQGETQALSMFKTLIIGNGCVGKTQVRRRLFGQSYDATKLSTHGIEIETANINAGIPPHDLTLSVWDFGGQDLYHGTHGLFIRSGDIFIVCWTPKLEDGVEHDPSGLEFPNRPLAYWLSWIAATAGKDVAVICVQTQADGAGDAYTPDPTAQALLEQFAFTQTLAVSAMNGRNLGALTDALSNALDWQNNKTGGALTGPGRRAVIDRLNQWRVADQALPVDQRLHRTLTRAEFDELCEEVGNISDPAQFLFYLNAIGLVFHRPGLFNDAIILDQAWALDAIYTVFTRGSCAIPLKAMRGRFTPAVLASLAWADKNHDEQALLLSMMESCGIAFPLEKDCRGTNPFTEYLAPALLPPKAALQSLIDRDWEVGGPIETHRLDYDFLHDGLIRTLMAKVGGEAGHAGTYWDTGFVVYETKTRSRLMVEASRNDCWAGSLTLQTRGPAARELLKGVIALIAEAENRSGLAHGRAQAPIEDSAARAPSPLATRLAPINDIPDAGDYSADALQFGSSLLYALSYSRNDAENQNIEDQVDAIEAAATARNLTILRDKKHSPVGGWISEFAARIAASERVIFVISHKFLKSPNCMEELLRVFCVNRCDVRTMVSNNRFWVLPCAKIDKAAYRKDIQDHWADEAGLKTDAAQIGLQPTDRLGTETGWNSSSIANHVASILAAIECFVGIRDLDAFIDNCFQPNPQPRAGATPNAHGDTLT